MRSRLEEALTSIVTVHQANILSLLAVSPLFKLITNDASKTAENKEIVRLKGVSNFKTIWQFSRTLKQDICVSTLRKRLSSTNKLCKHASFQIWNFFRNFLIFFLNQTSLDFDRLLQS